MPNDEQQQPVQCRAQIGKVEVAIARWFCDPAHGGCGQNIITAPNHPHARALAEGGTIRGACPKCKALHEVRRPQIELVAAGAINRHQRRAILAKAK